MAKWSALGGVLVMAVALSGCGTVRDLGRSVGIGSKDPQAERVERLKLPPDLSSERVRDALPVEQSEPASYAEYAQGLRRDVLPEPGGQIRVRKAGGLRWLEVDAPVGRVWGWVENYLEAQGVDVARRDPQLGVLQTDWLLSGSPLPRGVFGPRVADEVDARIADAYQFRLERGVDADSTEVYVAHRRVARDEDAGDDEGNWRLRQSDAYLEAEMLRGLMLHLGYEQLASVQAVARASGESERLASLEQTAQGRPQLVLPEPFFRGWRRVGLALDRLGFNLVDRDRAEGRYYVRYDLRAEQGQPEKGLFDSLAFWRDEAPDSLQTYVIHVADAGRRSLVSVETEDGQPVPAEPAARVLGLLEEQLR
ncbi:outer membrane protein assembly factor BamC [Alkalilimnicola sp. S0819]|uniref:outer membrane protein assembly factor BamC n=1 Tax=Alkalilimnicola sp. S0819 TaxID=2613922 RepID=UPI001869FA63|nr:outer membrane protein assembly factor BamC [Alkalilimnicola sp. S0819]